MSFDPINDMRKAFEGTAKKMEEGAESRRQRNDAFALNEFKKIEQGIELDPTLNIYTPSFSSKKLGAKKAQEAEALAQVFNARKQEILARKSIPGVTQTRTGPM